MQTYFGGLAKKHKESEELVIIAGSSVLLYSYFLVYFSPASVDLFRILVPSSLPCLYFSLLSFNASYSSTPRRK
jgi:hypothetical protein